MATPSGVAEKALKRITAQLECSICLDTLTDAKLLPCFHSFCKKCLERLVVKNRDGHTLCCPTCRRTTLLPPTGVSGLQTDFHAEGLFEIRDMLSKTKDPQKIQCEKCDTSIATGFCRDCGQFVCNKCAEMHQIWKEFKTHKIASFSDIQREAADLVPSKKKVTYCPQHSENILKIYCETCGELICNDCTIRLHRGHNYDLVTDTFQRHKEEIVSSLQPVKQHLATVNEAIQALNTRKQDIEEQRVIIEADIHKQINRLLQALEQRRTELVGQLDQLTQQKLKDLAAQKDQCELVQTQLSSCLDYVESSLKTSSEGEILAMKTTVLKQVQQITAEFNPNTLAPEQKANMFLVTDNVQELHRTCQGLAKVVAQSVCPQKCYATGDGLKTVTVGEEATVTLHARDKDGKECEEPILDLTAELVYNKDGNTAKCQVKEGKRGEHLIRYKPTTRGKHELHIRIRGKGIEDSPFTVRVRPPLQGPPIRVIGNVKGPTGLATNSKGHIIVAEHGASCISIFTPEGKKIQSFGSNGSANGQFRSPQGVAVDNDDNIYIVDRGNHRIQKFNSTGGFTASVGIQGSNPLQFSSPNGIGFNKKNGKLYVCDQGNSRVQVLETNLTHHSSFGSEGSGNAQFKQLLGVAFDSSWSLHIADHNNYRIQVCNPEGKFIRKFGSKGSGPGQLDYPSDVALDSSDIIYVVDCRNNRICIFSPEGQFLKSFGSEGQAQGQFKRPYMVCVDENDLILVSDTGNDRIQIF